MDEAVTNSSARDPEALKHIVQALMPGWELVDIVHFHYLSGGYSNENFRFTHETKSYVLRLPSRQRPYVNRVQEFSFYQQAHSVLIPELLAFDITSGAMLTRFEEGSLLTDTVPTVEELTAYLHYLHAALPPSNRRYDPIQLSREFLSAGRAPNWIRKLADRRWSTANGVPCHNDLNPWNIIVDTQGHWVTLDWESFGNNDPLFDLVALHQGLEMDDPSLILLADDWAQEFLESSRIEVCFNAFWLREYAWAHAERHHGNYRPEVDAQLSAATDKLAAIRS